MKRFSKKPNNRFTICIIIITLLCSASNKSVAQDTVDMSKKIIRNFKELPTIKWAFKTNSPIFASPIVSKNLVYFGSIDSTLYAVDIDSGEEQWHFKTKGQIRSSVSINNEKLFLNGGDGFLYTLVKSTGQLLWKFGTKGERKYDFADYFQSTPIINNGVIYFGSGDGNMYAVNSETGQLAWKFETGSVVHTTPAITNNKLFFGSHDGFVYALNLANGELIWKFKTVGHRFFPTGEVQGSPTVFNNLIFIGARDYNVYALDQEKGYCHWNKSFTKGWGLNSSIYDSVLYIGSADERILIAANPETGAELWRKNMEFLVFGNNAYSEDMLYVGTTIGKLHGINLNTGDKVWTFETETYTQHRFKYFKSDDSYRDDIYSIISSNEQFLDVEIELGGIFSTPYISNSNIIFTSTNGTLYCLKRH